MLKPLDGNLTYEFGHFAPDRWAWELDEVEVFPEPIPYRGQQGLFRVPAEVLLG
jgi:hypothetical protein